jgi:hypothetical protein
MYDIIGDIHGYADELEKLLIKLEYTLIKGCYRNPNRKVIFIGDYIDRGPKIRETLHIVKSMVDNGEAIALMGNHEYNALCFHTPNQRGGFLRDQNEKNYAQHAETLNQFKGFEHEWKSYLNWFKTLQWYFENKDFRAVHACWDTESIEVLKKSWVNTPLSDDWLVKSTIKSNALYSAVDILLKGRELALPHGQSFIDKDGNKRGEIRIKWWADPANLSYQTYSVEPFESLPLDLVDISNLDGIRGYPDDEKRIIFGHYWLKGSPKKQKGNVVCVDYSVAHGGKLVAYRADLDDFIF